MPLNLPNSVRYVKNGAGGQWWNAAKANGEVHAGWSQIPDDDLRNVDLKAIEPRIRAHFGDKKGRATSDFNALRALLERPSQHVWVTFEDGCMWWCTVRDNITVKPGGETRDQGHFWLHCDRPWSNYSVGGRPLATANLPGTVTTVAGYQATVCQPRGWREILRVVRDEEDSDAVSAVQARMVYEAAVEKLVARLRERDFELLIDLVLSRTGWVRVAKLGGAIEGIDIEAENVAADEIAFVQVKSTATQNVLNDYIQRFQERRARYDRMIFTVHTPKGPLIAPESEPVQVWTGPKISQLVVRLGLSDWVANRL